MDAPELSSAEFHKLRDLIYSMTGIALSDVKRQLMQSRLQRRLRHHGLTSFRAYYELLTQSPFKDEEAGAFINCLTTNTTSFFREAHHFDYVVERILPQIEKAAERDEGKRRLRVWHAGCSSGEEPYSLAITLRQALAKHWPLWDIRQLASDIDTEVLSRAAQGVYESDRIERIPLAVRRASFLRGRHERSNLYKVKQELRDLIAFRTINLLEDWPFRPEVQFDMVWCRNVIIYFDKATQQRLFERFARVIRPGGYMFIGHSESLHGITDALYAVGQTIYRKPEPAGEMRRAA